jgi:hypothetical protein
VILRPGFGGGHQRRQRGGVAVAAQRVQKAVAVHDRHVDINDAGGERHAERLFQPFHAVDRLVHPVAFGFEDLAVIQPHHGRVVDHQDVRPWRCRVGAARFGCVHGHRGLPVFW